MANICWRCPLSPKPSGRQLRLFGGEGRGRKGKKRLNGKRSAAAGSAENGVSPEAAQPDMTPADGPTSAPDTSSVVEPASPPTPPPPHPPTPIALAEAPGEDVEFTREGVARRSPAPAAFGGLPGEGVTLTLDGFTLDEATLVNSPMLPYVAMVASLIEGRTIRPEELLHALRKSLRQRSFDRLPRREYVLRFLDQHPP